MPTVLLVRHGETDTLGKRLAGQMPGIHLNKKGRHQAEALAENLAVAPLSAIYSSPLERAMETATPLAQKLNIPVQQRSNLIEVDYGRWQNRTIKQLLRLKLWKVVMSNPEEVRFPGGESLVEVQDRARKEIETIAGPLKSGEMVACFTHADVIRLCVAYFLNMALNDFHRLSIATASITAIHFHDGRILIPHINQVLVLEWPHAKPSEVTAKN
jgi:probable phosphomutase (TIGR03848 family)